MAECIEAAENTQLCDSSDSSDGEEGQCGEGVSAEGVPEQEFGAAQIVDDNVYVIRKRWLLLHVNSKGKKKWATRFPPNEAYTTKKGELSKTQLQLITNKTPIPHENWLTLPLIKCPDFFECEFIYFLYGSFIFYVGCVYQEQSNSVSANLPLSSRNSL
jgi:hypothetical protein